MSMSPPCLATSGISNVRSLAVARSGDRIVARQLVYALLHLLDMLQQARHLCTQASDTFGGTLLLPLKLRRQRLQGLA